VIPEYRTERLVRTDPEIFRRLRRIERVLRRLEKAVLTDRVADKFQSTGDLALPMTGKEVGEILGITRSGVGTLVCLKKLKRRWSALAGFHPDDVRAYLASKEKKQ
jgi:hypothetical protein